jgi:hypothetical protein
MKQLLRLSLRSSTVARAAGVALLALAVAGRTAADEPPAPPPQCVLHLVIELTPDVPNPRDSGFVSSLLGDHAGYQLSLRHVIDDTHLDMLLFGPGPKRNCREIVDSMRKDARIASIEVQ